MSAGIAAQQTAIEGKRAQKKIEESKRKMRLDKYVSLARIGTRKKVKEYIYRGEVQVNGETVLVPALEVDEKSDEISYRGKVICGIEIGRAHV